MNNKFERGTSFYEKHLKPCVSLLVINAMVVGFTQDVNAAIFDKNIGIELKIDTNDSQKKLENNHGKRRKKKNKQPECQIIDRIDFDGISNQLSEQDKEQIKQAAVDAGIQECEISFCLLGDDLCLLVGLDLFKTKVDINKVTKYDCLKLIQLVDRVEQEKEDPLELLPLMPEPTPQQPTPSPKQY